MEAFLTVIDHHKKFLPNDKFCTSVIICISVTRSVAKDQTVRTKHLVHIVNKPNPLSPVKWFRKSLIKCLSLEINKNPTKLI